MSSNQNNRLMVYILMPPGHPKDHYTIEVQKGGNEIVIDYTWPEEMLDPTLFMKGHNQYTEGHNKIVAFKEHVKQLREGKNDNKVKSECRLRLPFPVEEQLTSHGVPHPLYVTTTRNNHRVLAVEMMGVHSNFASMKVVDEFDSPTQEDMPTEREKKLRRQEITEQRARQEEERRRRAQEEEEQHRRWAQEEEEEEHR